MNNSFIEIREDLCANCNSNRSIECYDSFGNSINYTLLVDKYKINKEEAISKINKRSLSYMKCKICNTIYIIDWRDKFPKPLRNEYCISEFLKKYYDISQ